MVVKNKVIGMGKPLVCVSVMDGEKEAIVNEVKRLVDQGIEMIEWRVDAFSEIENSKAVEDVLKEVAHIIKETIFVFTFRSKAQGGECSLEQDMLWELHQVAAKSKVVDFIDVEYFATEDADRKINDLQKCGGRVITSHHDFQKTPSPEEILGLLEQMKDSNTDIVKLALMPNSVEDVLSLLEQTNVFHKKYPNQPLITMSMGKLGMISRISGEVFGSCVTFGSGKNASAPGQISASKLEDILKVLSS